MSTQVCFSPNFCGTGTARIVPKFSPHISPTVNRPTTLERNSFYSDGAEFKLQTTPANKPQLSIEVPIPTDNSLESVRLN